MIEECPWCHRTLTYVSEHDGNTYSHATSVEIRGVYDGGLFYADLEDDGCGKAWHRWDGASDYSRSMRNKAQPYMDDWNKAHTDD